MICCSTALTLPRPLSLSLRPCVKKPHGRLVTTTSILPYPRTRCLSLHLSSWKNGTRSMAIPPSPVAVTKVDDLLPYDDLITWPAKHNKPYNRAESERFLVVLDLDAFQPSLTRDEFIDLCIITLAMVVGSQEEARKRICSIDYNGIFGFQCVGLGKYYWQIMELPNVQWAFAESKCGGEPIDLTDPSIPRTSALTTARRVLSKMRVPFQSQMCTVSSKDMFQLINSSNKNDFVDEEGSTSIEGRFVKEDMEEEVHKEEDDDGDCIRAAFLAATRVTTGLDFLHHVVVLDGLDLNLTRDELVDIYIKTLAVVLGSEEEAKKNIYSIYTKDKFAFGCTGLDLEESYWKIFDVPYVRWVFPDSYSDRRNMVYGGEPYDPEVRILPLARSTSTSRTDSA